MTKQNSLLSPYLSCSDVAAAVKFYEGAFDAKEQLVLSMPDGTIMQASIIINGAVVMLVQEHKGLPSPTTLGNSPVCIHLNVADADASILKAEKAGAKITMACCDMFWGERFGTISDPFGHCWSFGTQIKHMSKEEIQAAAKEAMANMNNC